MDSLAHARVMSRGSSHLYRCPDAINHGQRVFYSITCCQPHAQTAFPCVHSQATPAAVAKKQRCCKQQWARIRRSIAPTSNKACAREVTVLQWGEASRGN